MNTKIYEKISENFAKMAKIYKICMGQCLQKFVNLKSQRKQQFKVKHTHIHKNKNKTKLQTNFNFMTNHLVYSRAWLNYTNKCHFALIHFSFREINIIQSDGLQKMQNDDKNEI